MTGKEIQYRTLRWGPCVVQLKVLDEIKNQLLAEAEKSNTSYGNRLAGHLSKEVKLNSNNYKNFFNEIFTIYNHALGQWLGKTDNLQYIVSDLWCNFQRANEFNPPHNHSGILSFVIYLKVPEAIKKNAKHMKKLKKVQDPDPFPFLWAMETKKILSRIIVSFRKKETCLFFRPG